MEEEEHKRNMSEAPRKDSAQIGERVERLINLEVLDCLSKDERMDFAKRLTYEFGQALQDQAGVDALIARDAWADKATEGSREVQIKFALCQVISARILEYFKKGLS